MRILEIPDCKMVVSPVGMFGDGKLEAFGEWFSAFPKDIWPRDFLYFEYSGFRWAYIYSAGMDVPAEFEVVDWRGGLYAVATGIDQQTDKNGMDIAVEGFISGYGFEFDESRPELATS